MEREIEKEVARFMYEQMLRKFETRRVKVGKTNDDMWWDEYLSGATSVEYMFIRMMEEVGEFAQSYRLLLKTDDPAKNMLELENMIKECADVANFAALIAFRLAREAVTTGGG